ncbi:hypothetical protein JQ628_05080 [Bradyrhizobium lablabi]|uniref:hypothetical protein n=1 Tax=Bradyrhizobium lablabi TaxID=722472 RepID=UPI001BA65670|nr:hypothetical protein [Bradyrhizobium lablabi]MBR1120881.1 hypothetical protein [Bradyrhizobium lablabi]
MAKDPDHLAGFDTENTGGVLSGFLAEEDQFDRHALWRLGTWGVAAIAAVVVGVMANQSSLGWRREQMVTTDLLQQANRLQTVAKESQNESRRLASAIDTLNSDRDRLYSRVTVLEQGLDSVTGAIARQHPALTTPPAATAPEPPPAPAVAPVTTAPAAPTEKAPSPAPAAEPAPVNVAKDVPNTRDNPGKDNPNKETPGKETPSKDAPAREASSKPAASPATPLVESKSIMAPPDPAAAKLIEPGKSAIAAEPIPEVVAAAPVAGDARAEAETSLPTIQRTEFGVDVGGANSVPGLRALWRGLLKSRSNAPLAALRPIIVIKEGTGGLGMQLRLVAGPLRDAAAAAKICAVMNENKRPCETAVFDGQRLTVDADEPAPAAKPAPSRRRGAAKQAAVEEAAKKPEPAPATTTTASTISSFFSRKKTE